MVVPDHLKVAVMKASEGLTDATPVSMYIMRETASKKPEKQFELWNAQIEDEIPKEFRKILKQELNTLGRLFADEKFELRAFFDTDYPRYGISDVKVEEIEVLGHILAQVNRFAGLKYLHDMSQIKEFDSYAIEFHINDGKVIYFSRIGRNMILKKSRLKGLFSNGKFTAINGDVMAFNPDMDCLYFQKTKSVVVLDKLDTEAIFALKIYYQTHAETVLATLNENLITLKSELQRKVLTGIQIPRRITKLYKENKFDKTIDIFQKHLAYFSRPEKELDPKKTQLKIVDNKVVIETEEQLTTFLAICDRSYVEDIIDHNPFLTHSKEDIRKKKKQD